MNNYFDESSNNRPFCCRKLEGRIKNRGMRMTIPRQLIAEVLETSESYLSAEEIFTKIKEKYPAIGLATVYRTLVLMEDMDLISRHTFTEGKARYFVSEKSNEKHIYQFICEKCYKVMKFSNSVTKDSQLYQKVEQKIIDDYNFEIKKHVTQFFGLCPNCKNINTKTGGK